MSERLLGDNSTFVMNLLVILRQYQEREFVLDTPGSWQRSFFFVHFRI